MPLKIATLFMCPPFMPQSEPIKHKHCRSMTETMPNTTPNAIQKTFQLLGKFTGHWCKGRVRKLHQTEKSKRRGPGSSKEELEP